MLSFIDRDKNCIKGGVKSHFLGIPFWGIPKKLSVQYPKEFERALRKRAGSTFSARRADDIFSNRK